MPRGQGTKVGREERHKIAERARKERKRLRLRRGEIYRVLQQAEATRRRRKKGVGEVEKIMRELGYEHVSDTGTIDERYREVER